MSSMNFIWSKEFSMIDGLYVTCKSGKIVHNKRLKKIVCQFEI
jgi:hypothetical protein